MSFRDISIFDRDDSIPSRLFKLKGLEQDLLTKPPLKYMLAASEKEIYRNSRESWDKCGLF